ncbi:MAG: SDR family oxidoreductase, partial [Saprospiraceae bacterium]
QNPDNQKFSGLIAKIYKTAKKQQKQPTNQRQAQRAADIAVLQQSQIAKNALENTTLFAHEEKSASAIIYRSVNSLRNCYICQQQYCQIHSFYHRLCPACAEKNYQMRSLQLDLSGRKVILTGGRVKIGYATALKLLRSGAEVTITTRFPALALQQYQCEVDYEKWQDRLWIYGLDLRNLAAVNQFIADYKKRNSTLDILINNAAQTIQYTDDYYMPLVQKEQNLLGQYADNQLITANLTSVLKTLELPSATTDFNELALNRFGQPVDLRSENSWNTKLENISTYELLEVNLINHISPYLLIRELNPLLEKSSFASRFIINVTSSEGQFSYGNKTAFHPHTNMTKAALNMLTRTSAKDFANRGIFMNSVDVGWVSTGANEELRKRQFAKGYIPPLDSVDGAARILHPIHENLENKTNFVGQLLKNYVAVDW